jgi:hypothetical protein
MPSTPYWSPLETLQTNYAPMMRAITAITNANPAVVTTITNPVSTSNGYISGMICRLYIPQGFGMQQANQLLGTITVIDGLNFSINIDTTTFDPFVVPNPHFQQASVVNVGEVSSQLSAALFNTLNPPPF